MKYIAVYLVIQLTINLFPMYASGKKFQLLSTHLQADGKVGIRERQLSEIKEKLLQIQLMLF